LYRLQTSTLIGAENQLRYRNMRYWPIDVAEWVKSRPDGPEMRLPLCPPKADLKSDIAPCPFGAHNRKCWQSANLSASMQGEALLTEAAALSMAVKMAGKPRL